MILLLCMQPWFSFDSKPMKMTWKLISWIHDPKNLSPHWNYQVFDIFSPFLLVLNHICQSRIKVACKVAKSFLTLFSVTLVKVEVQESNLHQMNHKKVYFLTCFMQNIQKPNILGSRALNVRSNHYGPPCKQAGKSKILLCTAAQCNNYNWHPLLPNGYEAPLTHHDSS